MPDPDLEIRGWGGGSRSSRPLDGRGGGLPKKFFRPFGSRFSLKIMGGPGSPGTSFGSATE